MARKAAEVRSVESIVRRPYHDRKTYTLTGGFIGLAAFVIWGLMPSILYGGFAGTALAHGIAHGDESANGLSNVLVLFGMMVGGLSVSGVFVILGAVAGAIVYGIRRRMGGAR